MKSELAGTTKLLKSVTSLRFANRRTFAIEPEVDWLAKSKLTPTARRQLVAILGSDVDTPAQQNVEWFDVFDQDDVVQFQLWLCAGNGGVLFKAATTVSVATVEAASFAGAASGLDEATGERLAALLRTAKKIAAKLHPGSALAAVGF
ncbi:MAG: hypothetical protein JWO86_1642 [Myxococcaceae bacterium]|nr:hypothetical protein [Myxococcaceae bacterium]